MLKRMCFRLFFILVCSSAFSSTAHAFFEEEVKLGNKRVSTVHYHLSRALARCAGFDANTAETIAGWDQVVDSLSLDLPLTGHIEQNFSVRMGPNDPFFHWPRPIDQSVMKRWVEGKGELFECKNRSCTVRRPITTGLTARSHEAFGVYLHSVGDAWSHSDCINAGHREHTDSSPECPLDTHHDEFGPLAADRTYQGIKAMAEEIMWWATENNTFSRIAPGMTEEAILNFVSDANFDNPTARVQIAEDLYNRCALQDERVDVRPTSETEPPVPPSGEIPANGWSSSSMGTGRLGR